MNSTTPNRGRLIVFEGIDGTGKSSQISRLAVVLRDQGRVVVETAEPTHGQFGRQIRALYTDRKGVPPERELELFLADRREHVQQIIRPALREGKIVLCDRYFLSTAAYQGGNIFSPAEIIAKNDFAPTPDMALLFRLPVAKALLRITVGRREVLNDFEQEEALNKVAAIFDNLELPYIRRIDASGTVDSIHQAVLAAVSPVITTMK